VHEGVLRAYTVHLLVYSLCELPVARRNTRACDVQCSVVYACSKLGACVVRVVYILYFVALHMGLYCVLEPAVARYSTVRFAYI
jgi:hypothetical protein